MSLPAAGDAWALASTTCFASANVLIVRGTRPGVADNGAFLSLIITAVIAGGGWLALGLVLVAASFAVLLAGGSRRARHARAPGTRGSSPRA